MAGVGVVRVRRADNSGSYAYGSIEHDQVQRAFDALYCVHNVSGELARRAVTRRLCVQTPPVLRCRCQ